MKIRHHFVMLVVGLLAVILSASGGAQPAAAQFAVSTGESGISSVGIQLNNVPGQTIDPSKVDLRKLEKEIFAEINKIRKDPNALAAALEQMKTTKSKDGSGTPIYKLPDGSIMVIPEDKASFITTAIDDAKKAAKAGLNQLAWGEGLAQSARDYAETKPTGHFDNGTNPGSRALPYGAYSGIEESISFGGNTAINHVYGLYIDSGNLNPGTGHRDMMIGNTPNRPTHLGVGCAYNTDKKSITCVVEYVDHWVEKAQLANMVVGQQYAYSSDGVTFKYVKITNIEKDSFGQPKYSYQTCPKSSFNSLTQAHADFRTVSDAKALNLVATNTECAGIANGVRNSGGPPAPLDPPAAASCGSVVLAAKKNGVTDLSPSCYDNPLQPKGSVEGNPVSSQTTKTWVLIAVAESTNIEIRVIDKAGKVVATSPKSGGPGKLAILEFKNTDPSIQYRWSVNELDNKKSTVYMAVYEKPEATSPTTGGTGATGGSGATAPAGPAKISVGDVLVFDNRFNKNWVIVKVTKVAGDKPDSAIGFEYCDDTSPKWQNESVPSRFVTLADAKAKNIQIANEKCSSGLLSGSTGGTGSTAPAPAAPTFKEKDEVAYSPDSKEWYKATVTKVDAPLVTVSYIDKNGKTQTPPPVDSTPAKPGATGPQVLTLKQATDLKLTFITPAAAPAPAPVEAMTASCAEVQKLSVKLGLVVGMSGKCIDQSVQYPITGNYVSSPSPTTWVFIAIADNSDITVDILADDKQTVVKTLSAGGPGKPVVLEFKPTDAKKYFWVVRAPTDKESIMYVGAYRKP